MCLSLSAVQDISGKDGPDLRRCCSDAVAMLHWCDLHHKCWSRPCWGRTRAEVCEAQPMTDKKRRTDRLTPEQRAEIRAAVATWPPLTGCISAAIGASASVAAASKLVFET
jgi:hypothetical protein